MIGLKVIITESSLIQVIDIRKSINAEIVKAARSALKEIIVHKQFAMRELDVDGMTMEVIPFVEMPNLEHVQMQGSVA